MRVWFVIAALSIVGCTNFLSKFEDIQANKTRPIAVVVEPAEAAPGDTVHVHYYGFSPDSLTMSIHWTAALDFSTSEYGVAAVEGHIVDIDAKMLPGSTKNDFYFVVPDSTLLFSTYLKGMLLLPWNTAKLTIEQADALLKNADAVPPGLAAIADMIGVKIKLMAHISAEIQLNIFKYMTVRYSRHLRSPLTNSNPKARWIKVCSVEKSGLFSFDSVDRYPHTLQYLYYPTFPDSVHDTVFVDSGRSYFIVADSCIDGADTLMQQYSYLSLITGQSVTARENYYYQWFYKDLDYRSSMQYDSLILFQGGNGRGNAAGFMPPVAVDTAMHRFKFYCVMRDMRTDFEATGENEYEVTGYFQYSDRYARNPHKQ